MNLIIGLGNPGPHYQRTRHNIGFQSVDTISSRYRIKLSQSDALSQWGSGKIQGKEVILAKPQTYMNLSGKSVHALMSFFRLTPEDVLTIYDDMDLPLGRMRIREEGSAGGHRGLSSIIQYLGTSYFARLRIGIGRPEALHDAKEYVLEKFSKEEQAVLAYVLEAVAECVEVFLTEGILSAGNKFNGLNIACEQNGR
ncbi:MAG: aminoacyl-tRNA hydrolase [bacterium]